MKKIINWDDIPSLESVGLDRDCKPITPLGKRAFVRIRNENIPKLFTVSETLVKVATVKQIYTGQLLDVSVGGLAINLPILLEAELPLKVSFYLGPERIISKGIVRHIHKTKEQHTTGVEFIDLDFEYAGYIDRLYRSLISNHKLLSFFYDTVYEKR